MMDRIAGLVKTCTAVLLTLCLSNGVAAETPLLTRQILEAYGFSTEQPQGMTPCVFKLLLDQTRFNEIMPRLLEKGMLGIGQTLEAANHHFASMETIWSVSIMAALVKQTYQADPKIDRCRFEGHFLVPDDYGHAQDQLAYSFDFDRPLFKRIDWDRMEARSLMKIGKQFHLSDWVKHEVAKESD
jgi:hypothetical protein